MNIPKSFFDDEIRCGFYISTAMKRAWAVQLELLEEILEIADKHNIQVWLEYGSLLGAVRHQGFIPWDDDLDISVLRKDYVPLLKYLQEELPSYTLVESFYTLENYNQPKAVISSRQKYDIGNDPIEADITKKQHGFPCSAWVDIFPMDYIPADKERWQTISSLYSAAYSLAMDMEIYIATGEFDSYLSQIECFSKTKLKRDSNMRQSIWMLSEKIASMTKRHEAKEMIWYAENIQFGSTKRRPLSDFSKSIFVPFEMLKAPIPIGYNHILHLNYGENYFSLIRGGSAHSYPFFKDQERFILSYNRIGQLGDIY